MEAAASNMLSSSLSLPPRTQFKQSPPPPSALKFYEPSAPTHSSMLATSLAQHFPTSVLIQEQRRESKPLLQTIKDDKTSQATSDTEQVGVDFSTHQVDATSCDEYLKEFQCRLLQWPGGIYVFCTLSHNSIDLILTMRMRRVFMSIARCLPHVSQMWFYRLPSSNTRDKTLSPLTTQPIPNGKGKHMDVNK
ncbi:hypothetical protein LXL04_005038 [Taraxacum kok-saghyz]